MSMSIEEEPTSTVDITELRRSMSKKTYTIHRFSGEITRMDIRVIRAIIQKRYKLVNLSIILGGIRIIQIIIQENKIVYCSEYGRITSRSTIKITPNEVRLEIQQPAIGLIFSIGRSMRYIQEKEMYRNVLAIARIYN